MSTDAPEGISGNPGVGFVLRRSDDSEFHRHFTLQLGPKRVRIGRDPDNEVYVTLNGVSSVHAELLLAERKGKGPRLVVRDLSVNGTGLKLPGGKKVVLNRGVDEVVPDGAELLLPMRASKADRQSQQDRRMYVIVELDTARQARATASKKRQMASDGAPAEQKRKKAKKSKGKEADDDAAGDTGEGTSGRLDAAALAVHNRKLAAADALQRTQTALSYTAKVAGIDPAEPVIQPVPVAQAEQALGVAAAATSAASVEAAGTPANAGVATAPVAMHQAGSQPVVLQEGVTPATSSTAPVATNQHPSQLPVRHWSVIIDRRAGGPLGISISTSTLYIEKITPDGLVDHFNAANPSIALQKGDRVLSVNGQSSAAQIVGECKREQLLQFFLCREGLDRVESQAPLPRTQPSLVPAAAVPSAASTAPALAVGVAHAMAPAVASAPVALAPGFVAPAALAPSIVAPTTLAAAAMGPASLASMTLSPMASLSTGGLTMDVPRAMPPTKLAPITPGAPQPKGMRSKPVAQPVPVQGAPAQPEGDESQAPSLRLLAARAILAASSISVEYQQRLPSMPTTIPQTESFIGPPAGLAPITPAGMAPVAPATEPPTMPAAQLTSQAPATASDVTFDYQSKPAAYPDVLPSFVPPTQKPPPPPQPQTLSSQAPLPSAPTLRKPPPAPPPRPSRAPPSGSPRRQAGLQNSADNREAVIPQTPPLEPSPKMSLQIPKTPPVSLQMPKTPPGAPPPRRQARNASGTHRDSDDDPPRSERTDAAVAKSHVASQIAAAKLAESGMSTDDGQATDDAARLAAARKALGDDADASSESRTRSVSVTPEEDCKREKSPRRNCSRSPRSRSSTGRRRARSWSRGSDRSGQQRRRERSRSAIKRRDRPRRHGRTAHGQRRSRSRTGRNERRPQLSGGNLVPIGSVPRPTCPSMPPAPPMQGPWRPPVKMMQLHSKMPGVPGPPPLPLPPPPPPPPSHMGSSRTKTLSPMQPDWSQHTATDSWTSPSQGDVHGGSKANGQPAEGDLDMSDL